MIALGSPMVTFKIFFFVKFPVSLSRIFLGLFRQDSGFFPTKGAIRFFLQKISQLLNKGSDSERYLTNFQRLKSNLEFLEMLNVQNY